MIKIAFFDIDGTLVSFNTHKVPQSAVDAVAEMRRKGIKVYIASGRQFYTIDNLGDMIFDGYITLNGGYCFEGQKVHKKIYSQPISKQDIERMIQYQRNTEAFPVIFVHEASMFINFENQRVNEICDLLNFPHPPIAPMEDALMEDVYQMISFFENQQEKSVMAAIPGCISTRWNPYFTDVIARGIDKRVGIERVLNYYGFTKEEAIAFGDGGNDIPMLSYIPNAVVMGNASDEVKAYASYITETVDNDGIAHAIQHYKLI